jgi:alpha-galactosidase
MTKITFLGAGSTIFAKNILGDCMLTPSLCEAELSLYDIDATRLAESKKMLETLNASVNQGRARITAHLGVEARKAALDGAGYVVNAIQVGGYQPCTVIDFEIPKRYGLRQTIGDTIGIGGIFRGLRTAHVMLTIARDMETVCPDAWLLNYTNPMSIVTGVMLHATGVKTVGLCHSVQVCAGLLLYHLGMNTQIKRLQWKIAGINHMGWLLEITDEGRDLYPEIRRRAAEKNREARQAGAQKHHDMVRYEMMRHFGYYLTESSEHAAEYYPYWIKSRFPELIDELNIPLDEYPRRCERQIEEWKSQAEQLVHASQLDHRRTGEYGSYIMEAIETDAPVKIGGNLRNDGLIPNLPAKAVVEVPCLVDRNGVQGCHVGDLPEQCAALCRAHIAVHLLTIEAATQLRRESIYHAASLDPHTASELTLDQIRSLCDDLLEAEAAWLPEYR